MGTTFFSGKNGETLTINPKLLEKMQNDPKKDHIAYLRNEHGYKMSEKLQEERQKNSEKLIEKSKEKIAKKKVVIVQKRTNTKKQNIVGANLDFGV